MRACGDLSRPVFPTTSRRMSDSTTDPQRTPPEADPALESDARAHAAEPAPPDQPAAEPEDPQALLAQRTAERDDMRDRWLRAEAEMQNVRARAKKDVDDTRQYAVQKFAADVVEAAENLRRGLSSLPAPQEGEPEILTKLREGFEGVERSFVAILERNGVKRQDPTGQPFDANLHQAMAEQPSGEHKPGTVIQAWTQAWTLNGRLLKPAMVVVAKAGPDAAADAA
jgi:molecular chaperone GrpE